MGNAFVCIEKNADTNEQYLSFQRNKICSKDFSKNEKGQYVFSEKLKIKKLQADIYFEIKNSTKNAYEKAVFSEHFKIYLCKNKIDNIKICIENRIPCTLSGENRYCKYRVRFSGDTSGLIVKKHKIKGSGIHEIGEKTLTYIPPVVEWIETHPYSGGLPQ